MDNLDKILEGLLFLSGDGLDRGVIMEKLQVTPKELNKAVEVLKQRYNDECGINMITYKDKLQLCASPKYADDVSLVLNPIRERQLTKATLEVMAIIAYKQPVTRIDVQDIRGINSDYAIQTLLNYKLIEVVGRKDAVGKPLLFGTTDEFLRHFGINDLNELPDYDELMKNVQTIQLENNHLYNEFDIPNDEENQEGAEVTENKQETETQSADNSNTETVEAPSEETDNQVEIKNEKETENAELAKNSKNQDFKDLNDDAHNKYEEEQNLQENPFGDLSEFDDLEIDEDMTLEDFEELLKTDKGKKLQQKLDEMQGERVETQNKQTESEMIDGIDYSLLEENPDIDME